MPLREYKCSCGHTFDELFDDEYPECMPCPGCGHPAKNVFGAPSFKIDFNDGWDPGAGSYFGTARQRDTYLDRNDLVKAPDGAFDQAFGEKVRG